MLTGRQPFQGETVSDVLASVLAREPDLSSLPPDLAPRLSELLKRCLGKHPKRRWQAIGDVRHELEVVFQSDRGGDRGIYGQRADGSGTAERLTAPGRNLAHFPETVSPDGSVLLFNAIAEGAAGKPTEAPVAPGKPVARPFTNSPPTAGRMFDIAPQRQGFLGPLPAGADPSSPRREEIRVVLNWTEELRIGSGRR